RSEECRQGFSSDPHRVRVHAPALQARNSGSPGWKRSEREPRSGAGTLGKNKKGAPPICRRARRVAGGEARLRKARKGDLRAEVKRVVWHEVAHWLGYETEEQVKALGL